MSFNLAGKWVVLDIEKPPRFKQVWIYGVLEFDVDVNPENGKPYDFVFAASHIVISGGRLIVGWPNNPLKGSAQLVLWGNHLTEEIVMPAGPVVGAKAIGKFRKYVVI